MIAPVLKHKFTGVEYRKMAESGILTPSDRVELIRGEIIEMPPIGTRHAAMTRRMNRLLTERLGDRVLLDVQNPIDLDEFSQPQPDLALLRPREDFYVLAHPQPTDIFLLVEVSNTTIRYDREITIPLYAERGIIEVWLIDIEGEGIEVYRQPTGKGYRSTVQLSRGDRFSMQAFPDIEFAVDEILGSEN
ncbi:MAG: Uma2 family endonuclease [Cyanobacteria bacterium P01_E01_bin.42]